MQSSWGQPVGGSRTRVLLSSLDEGWGTTGILTHPFPKRQDGPSLPVTGNPDSHHRPVSAPEQKPEHTVSASVPGATGTFLCASYLSRHRLPAKAGLEASHHFPTSEMVLEVSFNLCSREGGCCLPRRRSLT